MSLEKPPDARLDVTGPFPQRREMEPEDVQTVVKISAKPLPRDRLLEILVGGGDNAYIDGQDPLRLSLSFGIILAVIADPYYRPASRSHASVCMD